MQTVSALSDPFTAATLLLLLALVLLTFSVNMESPFISPPHLDASFTVRHLLVLPLCDLTLFFQKSSGAFEFSEDYFNNMSNVITRVIESFTEEEGSWTVDK